MASLQKKGDSYYCQFCYHGRRHIFPVGAVEESEAENKTRRPWSVTPTWPEIPIHVLEKATRLAEPAPDRGDVRGFAVGREAPAAAPHGTPRLNVPQGGIVIGVPAYRDPEEITFPKILVLPFEVQRPTDLLSGLRFALGEDRP